MRELTTGREFGTAPTSTPSIQKAEVVPQISPKLLAKLAAPRTARCLSLWDMVKKSQFLKATVGTKPPVHGRSLKLLLLLRPGRLTPKWVWALDRTKADFWRHHSTSELAILTVKLLVTQQALDPARSWDRVSVAVSIRRTLKFFFLSSLPHACLFTQYRESVPQARTTVEEN